MNMQDVLWRFVLIILVRFALKHNSFTGDDSSWATPQTVHTYYRNIQMWGSSSPSLLSGQTVNAALSSRYKFGSMGWTFSTSILLLLFIYL
jgi:hypothetical protein